MSRDMQFDILDRVRQTGFSGSGVLYLSRLDAEHLIKGIPELDATSATPDDIGTYAGTHDVAGVITYRVDEQLPWGVAHLEREDGVRVHVILHGI